MEFESSVETISLTGAPTSPRVQFNAAFLLAATCPTCGRFSRAIEPITVPIAGPAGVPIGIATSPYCFCQNGHHWPLIGVSPDEEGS
jgi:hypothetical protein